MRATTESWRPSLLLPVRLSTVTCTAGLALLAACSSSSASEAFVIRSTSQAVAASSTPIVQGPWLVYFASEAGTGGAATDLNNDGDTGDTVACVVRLKNKTPMVLGVAASGAAVNGDEIYLITSEQADSTDWDNDGTPDDLVLLHWSEDMGGPTFVDTLATGSTSSSLVRVGDRLYYAAAGAPVGADDTSLKFLLRDMPLVPMVVMNEMGGGQLHPTILGERSGLLFLSLDELVDGNLNGDGDSTDRDVLALLDGTDPAATLVPVSLALPQNAPFDAESTGVGDWRVAFLVSESGQAGTNLNDPTLFGALWPAENCGTPDADLADEILHFLTFSTFAAGTSSAVNTGLAGTQRVLVVGQFVATLTFEQDANCDLNNDGDQSDRILRWVDASVSDPMALAPPGLVADMVALHDTSGGSRGVTELQGRFVVVVSEAQDSRDYDGKANDHNLLAWRNPTQSSNWTFQHLTGITNEPFIGVTWLSSEAMQGRLGVAYQEEVPALNLNTNLGCDEVIKDTLDMGTADTTDSLVTWVGFNGNNLDLDGIGYAVPETNPGIVLARTLVFFRASEAADNFDYNNDGDKSDFALLRTPIGSPCPQTNMATSSSVTSQVVFTDGDQGAAFVSAESQANVDFNGDGDTNDLVVRYFNF